MSSFSQKDFFHIASLVIIAIVSIAYAEAVDKYNFDPNVLIDHTNLARQQSKLYQL